MKIALLTNIRAPYRTLQLREFAKIKDSNLNVYYTNKPEDNRKWEIFNDNEFTEIDLKGHRVFHKYGYINYGLLNIVKRNDLIILGGYEQPTYILISIICRLLKKPYILLFDGISTDRLTHKENKIKKNIKKIVIKNAEYIMGNGTVSKRYFNEVFGYPLDRIYNQYLTVDSEQINRLYKNREKYRDEYRKKLGISKDEKVLLYSGRLINIKNVDTVMKSISKLNRNDITFLITGGGELEEELKILADKLGVKTIITGFISEQKELFKHYFVGDALILPSIDEVWGLVVNEAMFAALPVLVSDICGCSLDLVQNGVNGYVINPKSTDDIRNKIDDILYKSNVNKFSKESKKIIEKWTFKESRKQLELIIEQL